MTHPYADEIAELWAATRRSCLEYYRYPFSHSRPKRPTCMAGHPRTPKHARLETDGNWRCVTCDRARRPKK